MGVEYVHGSAAFLQISRRSVCIVHDGILNVMLRHHLFIPADIIEGFVAETRRPMSLAPESILVSNPKIGLSLRRMQCYVTALCGCVQYMC